MDRPRGNYAKRNKSSRERQIPCDFSYTWNLKKTKQNKTKQKRNRLIDIKNNLVVARGEGLGGWAK